MQSYRPNPSPLTITGAAARSVASADAAAKAWWDHADALAAELERTLSAAEKATASDIASAADAWRAFVGHNETRDTLVTRWKVTPWSHNATAVWRIDGAYCTAEGAILRCADRLRYTLTNAGVPMGKMPGPVHSADFADYWRDAAARGC